MRENQEKGIASETKVGPEENRSRQVGIFFDQTRCDACYACAVACKDWHDIPPGPAKWLRVSTIEKGRYPEIFMAFNVNLCYQCEDAPCVAACPVEAIQKRAEDGIVLVDREKCLGRDECGKPCQGECPAGNDISGFISLVKKGKIAEAWALLLETNPFPGVCGRVCSHPCEPVCNRGQVDAPVAIHALERFVADHMHPVPPFTVERKRQRVAVVGSGPAGLSCAYQLARRGYQVTVFEALPVSGGMLRVGIPEYRLPKEILDREIAFIESLGVIIRTDTHVGKNLDPKELDQFDAVFLAMGAHQEKTLDIPGKDLTGVIPGLHFLREIKLKGKFDITERVIVLGGGNVAFDCARNALRLGAKEVRLICPESYEEMPAEPSEISQGQEEGIRIHTSRIPHRILAENGAVSGVQCLTVSSLEIDEEGILRFEAEEGSEEVLPAGMVLLAIGQKPDFTFLPGNIRVHKGKILIDSNGATSRSGVFAGGDAAIPEAKVAWAIGSGRRAAEAIHRHLSGQAKDPAAEKIQARASRLIDTDFIEKKERVGEIILPFEKRMDSFAEVQLGLTAIEARREAERCLECKGMCMVACPYDAPQFGAEDNPKMQKCDLCLEEWEKGKLPLCVRSCTMRALDAGPLDELIAKYGDNRGAEGFCHYEKSKPAAVFKPKFYRG